MPASVTIVLWLTTTIYCSNHRLVPDSSLRDRLLRSRSSRTIPTSPSRSGSASSSRFRFDRLPLGSTPVRSLSASSGVKLINVASPHENAPPEEAGFRFPAGERALYGDGGDTLAGLRLDGEGRPEMVLDVPG